MRADNPDLALAEHDARTEVDPVSWRRVRLQINDQLADGTPGVIEIETLRPLSWLDEHQAAVGVLVPVPLDLGEMGVQQQYAEVLAIEPCPTPQSGPGKVVLNTVSHLNADLFDLIVRNDTGEQEDLRVTGSHKIFSRTRQDWISTSSLLPGETLKGLDGPLTVASLEQVPGTFRVYNLTVEQEHVYHVSPF